MTGGQFSSAGPRIQSNTVRNRSWSVGPAPQLPGAGQARGSHSRLLVITHCPSGPSQLCNPMCRAGRCSPPHRAPAHVSALGGVHCTGCTQRLPRTR